MSDYDLNEMLCQARRQGRQEAKRVCLSIGWATAMSLVPVAAGLLTFLVFFQYDFDHHRFDPGSAILLYLLDAIAACIGLGSVPLWIHGITAWARANDLKFSMATATWSLVRLVISIAVVVAALWVGKHL